MGAAFGGNKVFSWGSVSNSTAPRAKGRLKDRDFAADLSECSRLVWAATASQNEMNLEKVRY